MSALAQRLDQLTAPARAPGRALRGHETRHIHVGPGAPGALAAWLQGAHPQAAGGRDLVVADAHTFAAAGQAVVEALRAAGRDVEVHVLRSEATAHAQEHLTCDDALVDEVGALLTREPERNPIAVGAGTVNDTVKMASFRAGRAYQVVPTAASMNGYTSAIAAVLSRGVKRTLPAHQPEALFADLEVLQRAPAFLARAGFGDLLSKPFSNADWLLSHVIRGVPYDPAAGALIDEAYGPLLDHAAGVDSGEAQATTLLMETLLVSGFSMALAGTSAPASGGEHLVSHYWDMEQHCQEAPLRALHGTQVGVATWAAALLYERLMDLDASAIEPAAAARRRPDDGWLDALPSLHPRLTPPVVAEVRQQIAAKQRTGAALQAELETVRQGWDALRARVRPTLVPAARVEAALRAAGCPRKPSDLGLTVDEMAHTLRVCRHIRARYVAWDLAADLGTLDGWAQEIAREMEAS